MIWIRRLQGIVLAGVAMAAPVFATAGTVKGKFLVGGVEAGLQHARARSEDLGNGKHGYGILLSARPAEGDISPWRRGDPKERGSFVYLIVEESGAVWVAELGHAAAKSGRFGVVMEVRTEGFKVSGGRVHLRLSTDGEQVFTDDHFSLDLEVDAPIEK